MKREEYLKELKLALEEDDFGPVEEAIAYFNEMLEDRMMDEGLDEEAAVATMEAPRAAAKQLLHTRTSQEEQRPQEQADSKAEHFSPGVRTIKARPGLVKSITVRDRNNRLILRGWDRDEIVIHHPETERVQYDFTLEDGQLSLIRTPMEIGINFFFFENRSKEMSEVTLDVPHELAADLNLRTTNGRLSAEQVNCWGKASLMTGNGALELHQFSAKDITAKTSNGSLTLSGVSSQQELFATTSNGRIRADKIKATGKLTLKTSNGSLEVHELESPEIALGSSNGKIHGTLPGSMADYTIVSGTSNGKNNLPRNQQGGSRQLSVHTSNARIDISFENGQGTAEQTENTAKDGFDWVSGFTTKSEQFSDRVEQATKKAEEHAERLASQAEHLAQQAETWAERFADKSERFSEDLADKISRAFDGEDDNKAES